MAQDAAQTATRICRALKTADATNRQALVAGCTARGLTSSTVRPFCPLTCRYWWCLPAARMQRLAGASACSSKHYPAQNTKEKKTSLPNSHAACSRMPRMRRRVVPITAALCAVLMSSAPLICQLPLLHLRRRCERCLPHARSLARLSHMLGASWAAAVRPTPADLLLVRAGRADGRPDPLPSDDGACSGRRGLCC